MGPITIREFRLSDYPGVCRVINSVWPDYTISIAELKHEDGTITKNGYYLKRHVAVGPGGKTVALGDVSERVERYAPGKLHLSIEVDRRFRRTCVWDELFERLEGVAMSRKATLLTARGSSRDSFTMKCLRDKGFSEASQDVESRIDLRKVSLGNIEGQIAKIDDGGIVYSTLGAEKRSNKDFAQDLYEMENAAGHDVPATDRWRRMTLSEYTDLVHGSPQVVNDAWIIAKDENRYVGENFLLKGEDFPRFLGTGFTCVLREFRGRGIAEGMKLRALLWAKKHGVEFVRTWNDSTNAPILGLNRKLGFRRYAVWFKLQKRLRHA